MAQAGVGGDPALDLTSHLGKVKESSQSPTSPQRPFPSLRPSRPPTALQTEWSVCHVHVWGPVWDDPGVGGRGQVCL